MADKPKLELLVAVPDAVKKQGDWKPGAKPDRCQGCARKVWLSPTSQERKAANPEGLDVVCPLCAIGVDTGRFESASVNMQKQMEEYGPDAVILTLAIKQLKAEGYTVDINGVEI